MFKSGDARAVLFENGFPSNLHEVIRKTVQRD